MRFHVIWAVFAVAIGASVFQAKRGCWLVSLVPTMFGWPGVRIFRVIRAVFAVTRVPPVTGSRFDLG
jgi:hypothetical protein